MHKIIIPNWHPLRINQLLSMHWTTRSKHKKADYQMIAIHALHVPKAQGKRSVQITIILGKGQRAGDTDSYAKSLLDGLVACGALIDDNRQHCELLPVKFGRGDKATIITLSDM